MALAVPCFTQQALQLILTQTELAENLRGRYLLKETAQRTERVLQLVVFEPTTCCSICVCYTTVLQPLCEALQLIFGKFDLKRGSFRTNSVKNDSSKGGLVSKGDRVGLKYHF